MPDHVSNSGSHGDTPGPVRQRFLASSHTLENVRRDFPEWHKGRAHYLLWALDVDVAAVRERAACASAHLADVLLDGYQRQPHVTLALCGFASAAAVATAGSGAISDAKSAPVLRFDDVGVAHIDAQAQALCLARVLPFTIDIGALDSFSSAPFFHVDDASGGIAALRTALASVLVPASGVDSDTSWDRSSDDICDYVAHVTVGLYGGAWPSAAVGLRLDGFEFGPQVRLSVDRISLMSYCSADIGGPLTTLAHYHLGSAIFEWHSRHPFAQ